VKSALPRIGERPGLKSIVSLRSAVLGGKLFFIATFPDGRRVRLDAQGAESRIAGSELAAAANILGATPPAAPQLLSDGDAYYYSHPGESAEFPVYRVLLRNVEQTRYYLDPISGEILLKIDHSARAYRWWHDALHRLDFSKALRSRPLWDVLMLLLLLGTSVVAATGCYAAVLRLGRPLRLKRRRSIGT
jgi:hypothetical protein